MVAKRVLITGGQGFLGRHVAGVAVGTGASVTVLDDGSSPAGPGAPELDPGVRQVTGSVLDAGLVRTLCAEADLIFHLAAVVGVQRVLQDPLRTLAVNTDGTSNVLHAAAERGTKVVYTSSSEVYGSGSGSPFAEDDVLQVGPAHVTRWTYAVSKLHGELLGLALASQGRLPFVAARMFNVVGPGQRADQGMVLPRFVSAALRGAPLTLDAPGTQQRSLLHVADAARMLWQLGILPEATAVVVNVGAPHVITMRELADRVVAACESSSPVVVGDPNERMPAGFAPVSIRVPSLQRLGTLLGPQPLRPVDTIIADAIRAGRLGLDASPS